MKKRTSSSSDSGWYRGFVASDGERVILSLILPISSDSDIDVSFVLGVVVVAIVSTIGAASFFLFRGFGGFIF